MSALFKIVTGIHVWLYRASGGKRFSRFGGKDIVLLSTKGRKTGAVRTVPLVSFEDGTDRIIVASKGGAPTHPAWFLNLQTNPDVTVELAGRRYSAKAVVTEPEERDRLFRKVVAEAPQFGNYEKKTTRVIPVVRLVKAS